jgi:hypothetical protein
MLPLACCLVSLGDAGNPFCARSGTPGNFRCRAWYRRQSVAQVPVGDVPKLTRPGNCQKLAVRPGHRGRSLGRGHPVDNVARRAKNTATGSHAGPVGSNTTASRVPSGAPASTARSTKPKLRPAESGFLR